MAVASSELPVLSGRQAHLDVVVPLDRLLGDPTAAPAEVDLAVGGRAPVPDETLRRWSCDAAAARIVLGPDSVPIDVGRDHRLFTPAQRRALAVRDQGCRFPHCSRPARYTDAHHVVAWSRGGSSDPANAVLLCRYHHRLVHEGGWTLQVACSERGANGVVTVHRPAGQRMAAAPRAP